MFTDYFYPELGGIQDSVATISRALGDARAPGGYLRAALRQRATTAGSARPCASAVWGPMSASGAGCRCRFPVPPGSPARRCPRRSAGGRAGRRAGRPDLIHVHSFFGIGLEALLNGACLGIPVIGTNHTTIAGFAPAYSGQCRAGGGLCHVVLQPLRLRHRAVALGVRRAWRGAAVPAAPGGLQPDRYRAVPPGAPPRTATRCGRGSACAARPSPMPAGSGRRRTSRCCCARVALLRDAGRRGGPGHRWTRLA